MRNAARRLPAEDHIHYPEDEGPLDAYSRVVAAVVDRVGPAVVRVESVAGRRAGVGSGMIIAGDGLVLTNSPRRRWRQARAPLDRGGCQSRGAASR